MNNEQERLVIAVSVGAGCMLLFVAIVLAILLCRARHRRAHRHDTMDRHLVGSQSVMSDGRYSSRFSESPHGNQRKHIFAKKEPSNSSALSGFVYKPSHLDRLRKNDKAGHYNKGFAKNTVRSHRSSRSLPVMANVSKYRMDATPSPPHFSSSAYNFSIPKAPATRSLYDYGRDVHGPGGIAISGFTRNRLPSSEQISFASDGHFVAPGIHTPTFVTSHNNAYAQQIPSRAYFAHQYQLKNSDFYTPRSAYQPARYMNGTIERSLHEREQHMSTPYRFPEASDTGQYYSSIGAVFDRSMTRT